MKIVKGFFLTPILLFFAFLTANLFSSEIVCAAESEHKTDPSKSQVLLNQQIESQILGKTVLYNVYLPSGYQDGGASWPTLYLLHGLHGSHETWFTKSYHLQANVDPIFAEHPEQKRIIISPDAGRSWYINDASGKLRYEDFFVQELIPEIERRFRCASNRENRAVAGLSMGGYGSLILSLHHPELFSACYAISASVRSDETVRSMPFETYSEKFGETYGVKSETEDRITETFRRNAILSLIADMKEEDIGAVRFTLDCGDDDKLLEGNFAAFKLMRERNIPVEFRVRDGKHDWNYFGPALPSALKFITN